MLSSLMRDKQIGKRIVPIVPDEARTFGMEGMFRQLGIYSSAGPALRTGGLRRDRRVQGAEGRPGARGGHQRGRRVLGLDGGGDRLQPITARR
jgi:hypothetical protein